MIFAWNQVTSAPCSVSGLLTFYVAIKGNVIVPSLTHWGSKIPKRLGGPTALDPHLSPAATRLLEAAKARARDAMASATSPWRTSHATPVRTSV